MIILDYGESALLINFEQKITEQINEKVIRLHEALKDTPGIHFTIPAYASLTVGYDPIVISADELRELIYTIDLSGKSGKQQGTRYLIPVCYETDYAPDMEEVCMLTGLNSEEIIKLHTEHTYRVYMLGFVAGFAYMGSLPASLQCPRKQIPRKKVPQGAIGLAGFQTGIYPTDAPGGWQIIGQTPLKTFDPGSDQPVRLQPGDEVKFKAISKAAFEDITDSLKYGSYEWEVLHG